MEEIIDDVERQTCIAQANNLYQALRTVGFTDAVLTGVRALIDSERWQFLGHVSAGNLASKIIRANGHAFADVLISLDDQTNNEVLKAAGLTVGARRRLRGVLRNRQRSGKTVLQVVEMYVISQLELLNFR